LFVVIQIYYMSSGFLLFIHNFSLQISEEPQKRPIENKKTAENMNV
jgi:hypothetical protein